MTKGMTLVGPRPERPAFCAEFEKRIPGWHYRTMVTPGLSGLAQVTGGYDLLPKEKVLLDLWRIERCLAADMTAKEWCALNKVAESSLCKWTTRFREEEPRPLFPQVE